eukprot:12917309-Prorocentrum_lima.AAC.1
MYVWEEALECYVTFHDEEELEAGEVEFYLPAVMAHWHESCPHSLREDEQLVLTVSKQRASAVIKREFHNLSNEEIQKHHKE